MCIRDRSSTATGAVARVKLPDIPFPKFDGNPRNFFDFRNLFESAIYDDDSLAPIQKFYFLKGALVGPAESFLKGTSISGNQYEAKLEGILYPVISMEKEYHHKRPLS